jgi:segregation and condensation protein B
VSDVPERDAQADSLAAQAAAWVPPWARQAPAEAEPTDEPDPSDQRGPTGEPALTGQPEPAGQVDPAGTEPGGAAEPAESSEVFESAQVPEAEGLVVLADTDEPETAESVAVDEFVARLLVANESEAELAAADDAQAEATAGDESEAEPAAGDESEAVAAAVEESQAEPAAVDEWEAEPVGLGVSATQPMAAEAVEDLPAVSAGELRPALEAILLVVDEPVAEQLLAQVVDQPVEAVAAELAALAEEYTAQGRGFELRRAAGGWRLYTRPEYAAHVERFVLDGQSVRLTQAALETLAVVAYKQPVTRSRISAIRGVNCDGVVRTLVTRGLIEESGTEPETGAYLYRTSNLFLEKLGLDSVDQLPPLAPFLPDNVDEIAGDVGR